MSTRVQTATKTAAPPASVHTSASPAPHAALAARPLLSVQPGLLQRKCACGGAAGISGECQGCQKKKFEGTGRSLQRAAASGVRDAREASSEVPRIVYDVLRSPGQPLDAAARDFFEPRFGHNFSQVRVHTDTRAAESAQAVEAVAYTVGRDVVFGAGQFVSQSSAGRRLLAHELTHVVQQGAAFHGSGSLRVGQHDDFLEQEAAAIATEIGSYRDTLSIQERSSAPLVQRDLATPLPAVAPPAQPDLTPAQIQDAINFNKARYNEANTRLIQDLLGGPVTGTWSDENIEAIAATQEQYGLHKDGKAGEATFRFLNREGKLEGMSTKTEDCLVSFRLIGPDPQNFGRDDATHCHFGSHFLIEAQFSPRCNCGDFEYRQFTRGHLHRTRAKVVTDLPVNVPGGALPAAFIEDTDITAAVPHYGHRGDAAEADPEDHYIDATGADDQTHGCRFRSEDTPGGSFDDCLAGDQYELRMGFRGEIQRNGNPIQQKLWTAVNLPNWTP